MVARVEGRKVPPDLEKPLSPKSPKDQLFRRRSVTSATDRPTTGGRVFFNYDNDRFPVDDEDFVAGSGSGAGDYNDGWATFDDAGDIFGRERQANAGGLGGR